MSCAQIKSKFQLPVFQGPLEEQITTIRTSGTPRRRRNRSPPKPINEPESKGHKGRFGGVTSGARSSSLTRKSLISVDQTIFDTIGTTWERKNLFSRGAIAGPRPSWFGLRFFKREAWSWLRQAFQQTKALPRSPYITPWMCLEPNRICWDHLYGGQCSNPHSPYN